MRITTNNGTTISGSLSEVLATLTHLGVKASDGEVTTKPVTTAEVTENAVTKAVDVDKIAQSIIAEIHAGEAVMPKLTRDGVVQQAIDDVKDLLSTNYYDDDVEKFVGETLWFVSNKSGIVVMDEVLFTINADKRTVVASIRYNKDPKDVYKKGRAKCAPGDVFNEHIGKAIALRRALGLAVPVEYYEAGARDSDDLAVGDVVRGNNTGNIRKLISENKNPRIAGWFSGKAFDLDNGTWILSSQVTLINDSARHTAPELEVSRIIRD